MDETLWGLMTIVGPIILLLLLVWLMFRSRKRPDGREVSSDVTEQATRANYAAEEQRRRDGVDGVDNH